MEDVLGNFERGVAPGSRWANGLEFGASRGRAGLASGLVAVAMGLPSLALAFTSADPLRVDVLALRNCAPICVAQFGAIVDDGLDDTEAIQAAVDAAVAQGGGEVLFLPGTYEISSVDVEAGLILEGKGTVLHKVEQAGKWARTFTTQNALWAEIGDSRPLVFRGLSFDGNRQNQGPYRAYELEQQHAIFLAADGPGRLVAMVEDCHFRDGVADAISVYTNVSATISRCSATDVFRGGITVTGGNTTVQVTDFRSGGEVHATGVDVEVDGLGYGGSKQVWMTMDGVLLEGDFDVALSEGSTFLGNNIRSYPGPFTLNGRDSRVRISNSVFGVGKTLGSSNRVVYPHDVSLSDCTFVPVPGDTVPAGTSIDALNIYFNTSMSGLTGQRMRLTDCIFVAGAEVEPEDRVTAIRLQAVATGDDNRLMIRGGDIGAGFDYGVWIQQGGVVDIRDVAIDADTALFLGSSTGYALEATVDGVRVGPSVSLFEFINTHQTENLFSHRNILLDSSQNSLGTRYGLANNRYWGRRVIEGEIEPLETPGLRGDLYRLRTPVVGEVWEWTCTSPHQSRATWEPVSRIAIR